MQFLYHLQAVLYSFIGYSVFNSSIWPILQGNRHILYDDQGNKGSPGLCDSSHSATLHSSTARGSYPLHKCNFWSRRDAVRKAVRGGWSSWVRTRKVPGQYAGCRKKYVSASCATSQTRMIEALFFAPSRSPNRGGAPSFSFSLYIVKRMFDEWLYQFLRSVMDRIWPFITFVKQKLDFPSNPEIRVIFKQSLINRTEFLHSRLNSYSYKLRLSFSKKSGYGWPWVMPRYWVYTHPVFPGHHGWYSDPSGLIPVFRINAIFKQTERCFQPLHKSCFLHPRNTISPPAFSTGPIL